MARPNIPGGTKSAGWRPPALATAQRTLSSSLPGAKRKKPSPLSSWVCTHLQAARGALAVHARPAGGKARGAACNRWPGSRGRQEWHRPAAGRGRLRGSGVDICRLGAASRPLQAPERASASPHLSVRPFSTAMLSISVLLAAESTGEASESARRSPSSRGPAARCQGEPRGAVSMSAGWNREDCKLRLNRPLSSRRPPTAADLAGAGAAAAGPAG